MNRRRTINRTTRPARRTRRSALYTNGSTALAAASVLAAFTTFALLGSGHWYPIHSWLAGAVAFFGITALLCFTLGARSSRPASRAEVTHLQVSHPPTHLTAHPS